jgi:hypothetical protein
MYLSVYVYKYGLYVCVYACMYVYMYAYIYAYNMYACMYVWMHVCMRRLLLFSLFTLTVTNCTRITGPYTPCSEAPGNTTHVAFMSSSKKWPQH